PIHTRAVKWIHERGRVTHENKTVSGEGRTVIREIFSPVHIFLIELCVDQNLARDRMFHQKSFQSFANTAAILRPIDQSLIEDNADTHVAALEWDPPAPPAVTNDMIRGGVARGINGARPLRIFLSQLAAVPIFNAFPSRPRRRSRV